jgi:tripartite-type tricarboxylate transporter receptor subunit TctC
MLGLLARLCALVMAAASATVTLAQPFPARAVTIVVPFPAGGAMDALGRLSAERLSAMWGQPVLVENRAGAGGLLGAQRVKGAAPDGYTLLLTNSALIQNVVGEAATNPPYDPVKDFDPVLHMTHAPVVFVINPRLPARTVQEFVALVKREPRKHAYGSGGAKQTLHLLGATFNEAAGLDMAHVPQKGDGPLINDIIGGHVSGGFVTIATAGSHIVAGTVRALGVVGPRSPLLPDVPTFREMGYTQLDVVGWFGLFAPAGTPKAIADRIAADAGNVLRMPEVSARLRGLALTPTGLGSAEFAATIRRDMVYWDTVVRKVGER